MSKSTLRICCIGDIVARDGREVLQKNLARIKKSYKVDFFLVNGENSAGGSGITPKIAEEFRSWGVNFITLGDHAWQHKEARKFFDDNGSFCIRPANYSPGAPGFGQAVLNFQDTKIGICNLIGRVFMNSAVDCPFRAADRILAEHFKDCKVIIVDFHAEATSEKIALGKYLNGRVSLLFGTHTHVQTADEQILSQGTAYISDIGMTGSQNGVIGLDGKVALKRFLSGLPASYKPARGNPEINGIVVEIQKNTGKAISIERINLKNN